MGLRKQERARLRETKLARKREKRRVSKKVLNDFIAFEKYDEIATYEKIR